MLSSTSIIIPTKDRPQDLERTILTVLAQTLLPGEIIIVDQSADHESRCRVEQQLRQAPDRIREAVRLRYIQDSSITGLAAARNRAMGIASGDVWVFLDDDVVLEPDFLKELLKPYSEIPGLTGASGIITNYPLPPLWFRAWTALFRRGPFHDDRQSVYWRADRLRGAPPIPVTRFTGALMSFRASAVRDLRFDEHLSGVSEGEDVDFCCRMPVGSSLVISPRARLAHMKSPQGRMQDHWLRRTVLGSHFLYRKNWRHGLVNRICFLWLNIGCGLLATLASLRHGSFDPWRALLRGTAEAKKLERRK